MANYFTFKILESNCSVAKNTAGCFPNLFKREHNSLRIGVCVKYWFVAFLEGSRNNSGFHGVINLLSLGYVYHRLGKVSKS